MRQTSGTRKSPGDKIVKEIKRASRKQYSSEEKIRIVLDGLRGEDSIAHPRSQKTGNPTRRRKHSDLYKIRKQLVAAFDEIELVIAP